MSEVSVVPTSQPPPPPSRPPVSFPTARAHTARRPHNAHDSTQPHAHSVSPSPSSSTGARRMSRVNQWNIPLTSLTAQSVSRAHVSLQEETHIRAQTAHFISLIGQHCKITQWAIATASVYMHVFYSRFSLKQYDRFEIAATCLFLAGKVEERRTRVDQVINAYFTIRLAAKSQRDQLKLSSAWFRDANGRPLKHPRVPRAGQRRVRRDETNRIRARIPRARRRRVPVRAGSSVHEPHDVPTRPHLRTKLRKRKSDAR